MPPKLSFFAPAKERIKYLKQKYPKLSFDYDEIMHYAHHEAFTVAKVTKLNLLQTIQKSLIKAQEEGQNFEVWKEQLKPKLQKAGWLGKTAVTNPSTGEIKEIFVGSKRLKTIYYTNLRTTQARSNYKEAINAGASGFRYIAILDGKTRAEHKLLHNIVRPINDKFWDTHYPPNGWNCRCKVMPVFSDSFTPINKIPDISPHPDWAYHVGRKNNLGNWVEKRSKLLERLTKGKLKEHIKGEFSHLEENKNFFVWNTTFKKLVKDLLEEKHIKSPFNIAQIGTIDKEVIQKTEKLLKEKIEARAIIANKKTIFHTAPKRKGEYNQALRLEEILSIPTILKEAKSVSVDKTHKNIIYWFEDKKDKTKINKIVVDLNYKIKKFDCLNYVVTFGKVDRETKEKVFYTQIR